MQLHRADAVISEYSAHRMCAEWVAWYAAERQEYHHVGVT
jgi:hypothetical protein